MVAERLVMWTRQSIGRRLFNARKMPLFELWRKRQLLREYDCLLKEFMRAACATSLSREQKASVLEIIFKEVSISEFTFGLVLEKNHIFFECWTFLEIIHQMGGFEAIRAMDFYDAQSLMNERMDYFRLNSLKKFYFEREKYRPGARSKYNCHVESIRDLLLRHIFTHQSAQKEGSK